MITIDALRNHAAQICTALLLLFVNLNGAQSLTSPYQVPIEELWKNHALGRAQIRFGDMNGVVTLRVTVNAQGAVESVTDLDGPKYALKKAEAAERRLHFQPFLHNGRAVRATFRDSVSIYPEERWGNRQPFPDIRNWKTASITLERREWCDEPRCLAYKIEIRGEGIVVFTRTKWASRNPRHLAAQISQQDVHRLLEEFRQADFLSMLDNYVYDVTDATGTFLTVSFDDHSKTVHEWAGLAAGSPTVLSHLEQVVDQVAIANGWIEPRN